MEQIVATLLETAGPVAAGIAVVLAVLVVGLKYTGVGLAIGSKTKLVDDDKLTAVTEKLGAIGTKVDSIESRLGSVERDMATRATTEEVHRMELAFTRLEGRFQAMEATGAATKEAVTRIEGFMLKAAEAALRSAR